MVGSNSNLNFWHDKWLAVGNVRSLISGPIPLDEKQLLVKDVRRGGSWDFSLISFDLSSSISLVLKAIPFPTCVNCDDKISWSSSSSGSFEPKYAYQIANGDVNSNSTFVGNWILKVDTMPKIQTFLWKCFLHSIPTTDTLEKRGFIGDVNC